MEKRAELYAGKAKSVYTTDEADKLIIHYRNTPPPLMARRWSSWIARGW